MERLDKIISNQLNISRSEARLDIRVGKVFVDGNLIRDPSAHFDPETAFIKHCGKPVAYRKYVYIVMNKPAGVLSASEDKSRQTVVDLVPEPLRRNGLSPVGRLDRDTTGLLLITDDGDFAHSVISPKSELFKTYIAELDGVVPSNAAELFAKGVALADGTLCKPAVLTSLGDGRTAEIRISEGKYHQIKRMLGTVGLGVNALKRTAVGGLRLPEDLAEGESRELSEAELRSVFNN